MNKMFVIVSGVLILFIYIIVSWYPNSDLIIEENTSIDNLHDRGWITLDRKLFEGSTKVKSVIDLDTNEYIILIALNKEKINTIQEHLLNLKCAKEEISSNKLKSFFDSDGNDSIITGFLNVRNCGVQGEWFLDNEKGLIISTSNFPFNTRVLEAFKNKF